MWFKSYLTNRCIRTAFEGVSSTSKSIFSGVPQGSALGPLLLILFFRDLPSTLNTRCMLLADDTMSNDTSCKAKQDASSTPTPCCRLESSLSKVSPGADASSTKFKTEKSVHVVFSRKARCPPDLFMGTYPIAVRSTTRHLGVILTSSLRWSAHIHEKLKQAQYKVFVIKRLAHRIGSQFMIRQLYLCLV